jgi:hypothetical protein
MTDTNRIDTDKYEGHLASEGKTWVWSKWMLRNAETIDQQQATAELLNDAPLLLEEYKRMRGLLRQVADEYTDADGIGYEIYCEFGDDDGEDD